MRIECSARLHDECHAALRRHLVRRAFAQDAAFARVRTLGVLADDDEFVGLGVAWRSACERSLIDVEVERKSQLEKKTALDNTRRHTGRADCTEQNRVEAAQLLQRLVAQHFAVAQIARSTEIKERRVEFHASCAHHLECFGEHFGADAVATDDGDAV